MWRICVYMLFNIKKKTLNPALAANPDSSCGSRFTAERLFSAFISSM